MQIRRKSQQISSYQELYDFVKSIKEEYNIDTDTVELIDRLIFKWFSRHRLRGLDTCYLLFNKEIEANDELRIIARGMQINVKRDVC